MIHNNLTTKPLHQEKIYNSLKKEEKIFFGNKVLKKVNKKNLQPGDIICHYHSIPGSKSDAVALIFQNLIFKEKNIHKSIHYEIVLKNSSENNSKVTIAHADGKSKKIRIEEENLDELPLGLSALVFRPQNKELANEITKIATITADGRGNKIAVYPDLSNKSLFAKINKILNFIKSQFFKKNKKSELKKLARLTIDSHYKFYRKDGQTALDMTCVEYVNNITNCSLIRTNQKYSEFSKDIEYTNLIREWNEKGEKKYNDITERLKKSENRIFELKNKKNINKKNKSLKETKETKKELIFEKENYSNIKKEHKKFLKSEIGKVLLKIRFKRSEMINNLYKKLKKENKNISLLLQEISSAGLEKQILPGKFSNFACSNDTWLTLGFMRENIDAPEAQPIEAVDLSSAPLENLGYGTKEDIIDVFYSFSLLDENKKFIEDVNGLITKSAFIYLFAKKFNMPIKVVTAAISTDQQKSKTKFFLKKANEIVFLKSQKLFENVLQYAYSKKFDNGKKIKKITNVINEFIEDEKKYFEFSNEQTKKMVKFFCNEKKENWEEKLTPFLISALSKKLQLPKRYINSICKEKKYISLLKNISVDFEKFKKELHNILYDPDHGRDVHVASKEDCRHEKKCLMVGQAKNTKSRRLQVKLSEVIEIQRDICKNSDVAHEETAELFALKNMNEYRSAQKKLLFYTKITLGVSLALLPLTAAVSLIALPLLFFKEVRSIIFLLKGLPRVIQEYSSADRNFEIARKKLKWISKSKRYNFRLDLSAECSFGERPWVHYSPDGGKTWKAKPMILKEDSTDQWQALLSARDDVNFQFKYFLGPDNPSHKNPYENAKWQHIADKDHNDFKAEEFILAKSETGLILPPRCDHPTWT